MKKLIVTFILGSLLAACTSEQDSMVLPQSASSTVVGNPGKLFDEVINGPGAYKVTDALGRNLYFNDGQPACPNESEKSAYEHVEILDLNDLQGIIHGLADVAYQLDEGAVYLIKEIDQDYTLPYYCNLVSDSQFFPCTAGQFSGIKQCAVIVEKCYASGWLLSSNVVAAGPCGPCIFEPDSPEWEPFCFLE